MQGVCIQIGLLVAITHGAIAIGRRMGHRRAGLLLGLPSTSALMLLSIAVERDATAASRASESCLLGLVAASALPVTYLFVSARGKRMPWPPLLAVLAYVAVALAIQPCTQRGGAFCGLVALLGVLAACRMAARSRFSTSETDREPSRFTSSPRRTMIVRSVVPIAYVTAIRSIQGVAGSAWSDLFMTFPGSSLAVMVTTHLELGAAPARSMAGGLPAANLSTLVFLTVFRACCLAIGPVGATSVGYMAASLVLIVLGRRSRSAPAIRARKLIREGRTIRHRVDRGSKPRGCRRRAQTHRAWGRKVRAHKKFSPRFEAIRR